MLAVGNITQTWPGIFPTGGNLTHPCTCMCTVSTSVDTEELSTKLNSQKDAEFGPRAKPPTFPTPDLHHTHCRCLCLQSSARIMLDDGRRSNVSRSC